MRVKLEFGVPSRRIKDIQWFPDISLIYKIIRLEGNLWEILSYDKDASERYDYIVYYGEVPEGDLYCEQQITDYERDIQSRNLATICECGSMYERGFENVHSFWCPKWEKA